MNKNLLTGLKDISELDYIILGHYLQTSNLCRNIQAKYSITNSVMAQRLGISTTQFKRFRNGAYDFTIMDLAKLQAIQMEYGTEKLKEEVEAQVSVTSEYKHSKKQISAQ